MKRKSGPEPPDLAGKRHPRQDPVSCDSCRKKKLKCDRQLPCSSCLTRRLKCIFSGGLAQTQLAHPDAHPERKWQSSFKVNESRSGSIAKSQSNAPDPGSESRQSLVTADWLEHIHMGDRLPAALSPQLRAGLDDSTLTIPQSAGPARILLSVQRNSWSPSENPATIDLVQYLPTKADTMDLFRYYCTYIDFLYHIIFPSVVERQIDEIYRRVEGGMSVDYGHLALLFAITGTALFVQFSTESSVHAARCSQQFLFLTGAALTQANYITYPTVEGLQAALIILHNVSTLHCSASVSGFFVLASIVNQAKDMGLHRLDTPHSREVREAQFDSVELETKRRLWWDIASLDWFLGFLSGPQEWTYLVNPRFMHTNRPANFDDSAVGSRAQQSGTAPTEMTYFLERLRVSDGCRSIVDGISAEQLSGEEVDYAKILDLDRELHQAQSEVPDFFRLDSACRKRFRALYQERPTLAWQRCILQQAYYSRLCRLHRPFFIRGARDAKYAYSHVVGMSSARKVLEIKRIMDEEEPRFPPSTAVIWSMMHHVFMAAVMLLLDVCYNADDILVEKRKEEVLDACRMLSKAQQSSSLVKEGIDAMMSVLRGHYKCGKPIANRVPETEEQAEGIAPTLPRVSQHPDQAPIQLTSDASQDDRGLEDIWSELIDNGGVVDFAVEDWTSLFTELTSTAMPVS
ncbi:Zn(II)2Cys6 transcription factor [Aspergillus lucknowensis]|uniref:Zn(2)-C6 fungal-type domain-containing protein n=1 Tax=Aspergillus lucknowensis TaxID=176173 RepID=A0ABR4M187_9EURO